MSSVRNSGPTSIKGASASGVGWRRVGTLEPCSRRRPAIPRSRLSVPDRAAAALRLARRRILAPARLALVNSFASGGSLVRPRPARATHVSPRTTELPLIPPVHREPLGRVCDPLEASVTAGSSFHPRAHNLRSQRVDGVHIPCPGALLSAADGESPRRACSVSTRLDVWIRKRPLASRSRRRVQRVSPSSQRSQSTRGRSPVSHLYLARRSLSPDSVSSVRWTCFGRVNFALSVTSTVRKLLFRRAGGHRGDPAMIARPSTRPCPSTNNSSPAAWPSSPADRAASDVASRSCWPRAARRWPWRSSRSRGGGVASRSRSPPAAAGRGRGSATSRAKRP